MKNLTEKFKYMECVTTKLFFLYGIVSCLFLTMLSLLSSSPPVWYAGDSFSSIFPLERDHHLVRSKFDQMCQNFTWTQYGAIYPNNRLYFCLINLSRTSETQLETRKAKWLWSKIVISSKGVHDFQWVGDIKERHNTNAV